jgi:predicted nucleotidyltransferase component of viral defense system
MPVHRGYEFQPARLPVMDLEESLAEKLAAFRRRGLLRDLYDLALFYNRPFDEDLVRKLTYLKVFVDVVEDGLGKPPFDPVQDILKSGQPSDFLPEDIGFLTGDVDISLWLERTRSRYRFLIDASDDDLRWAPCNPKDAYEVRRLVENLSK